MNGPSNSASRILRALVVEDDPGVRRLVVASLVKEGFTCDRAEDGEDAWSQILRAESPYDLVVTDLVMPIRHGHSLAVDLLAMPTRPVLAVLTGITEPRLAKDLLTRGVDDLVYKPVQFLPFAAKMRSLIDRRASERLQALSIPAPSVQSDLAESSVASPRPSLQEFDLRMARLSQFPLISRTAVDVFKVAMRSDVDSRSLAATIRADSLFVADILRIANSAYFNPAGAQIRDVDGAIMRLGQRRVGQLALASTVFAAVPRDAIPFLPLERCLRKALAVSVCLEVLLEELDYSGDAGSLFCAAVLQPIGRIMLATVFPEVYEDLLRRCESEHKSLCELEASVFPQNAGQVAATTLASWGIADDIHQTLWHTDLPFSSLAALPEPLCGRIELIKTASFFGELVAGHIEPWDLVDPPPSALLQRLGVQQVEPILDQGRMDLHTVALGPSFAKLDREIHSVDKTIALDYQRLNRSAIDLIPHLLGIGGVQLSECVETPDISTKPLLVNALDADTTQVASQAQTRRTEQTIVLTHAESSSSAPCCGTAVISLPCSFGALIQACHKAVEPPS